MLAGINDTVILVLSAVGKLVTNEMHNTQFGLEIVLHLCRPFGLSLSEC